MYMPLLYTKQGELRALNELNSNIARNIIPLLIFNDDPQTLLKKVAKKYPYPFLIDTRELDAEAIIELEQLLRDTDEYPDVEIAYPISVLINDSELSEQPNYVTIRKSDLNNDFFQSWLQNNINKLPQNIIIDLALVNQSNILENQKLIQDFILKLKGNHRKTIFIVSGTLPNPIPVKSTENYRIERYDYALYKNIVNAPLNNNTDINFVFGDYATVSPITNDYRDLPIIPIVQLKYTTRDQYILVRNGQRKGHYNLSKVCEEILNFPNFSETYCKADKFIFDLAKSDSNNKGNASTWATVGIEHHIVLCAEQNS